jgi:predicted permease
MKAARRFVKRITGSLLRSRDDERIREELAEHLASLTDEYVRAGFPADQAGRRARLTLGAADAVSEACRDEQRLRPLEDAWQDARIVVRQAINAPVFTLAVVGSLVLGIGATVTIYAVMRAGLWKPLAGVVEPGRIVHLVRENRADRGRGQFSSSYVLFQELRAAAGSAARVVAKRTAGRHRFGSDRESRERVTGEAVSDNFFAVLGVSPVAGRVFTDGDDNVAGGASVAVLSDRFWRTRFQSDPGVVGRTIYYDEAPFLVVGVAAKGFIGVDAERPIDIWIPITSDPSIGPDWLREPSYAWLTLLARLGPGANPAGLESMLDQRFRAHLETHLLLDMPARMRAVFGEQHLEVRQAAVGLATTGRRYQTQLHVLMGLALSILLISCANVASLVRARSERRRPEFAMRRALGASRGRLVRQLTTEGLLLTGLGAVGGLLLAPIAGRGLLRLLPNQDLVLDLTPDLQVIAVTASLAVACTLVVFAWPGWRLASVIHGIGSRRVFRRLIGEKVIVATQLATVMALLIVTGLALTMLRRLDAVPLGFDATAVWSAALSFPKNAPDRQAVDTLERLRRTLTEAKAVEAVTYAFPTVYDTGGSSKGIVPDGYVAAPGEDTQVGIMAIGPGFFEALHIPLRQGRAFGTADVGGKAVGVLVNEAFVRRYFPDRVALGRVIRMRPATEGRAIIGIVGDVRHYGVRVDPWPMVYELGAQRGSRLLLRARDPRGALAVLESSVKAEPGAQLEAVVPLTDTVTALVAREWIVARLSTIVAFVALSLAALGLYGVVSVAVACRRPEFGIRLALGAPPARVRWLVLRETGTVVGIGVGTGLALGYLASRALGRFITDVPPMDPFLALGAALCLGAAALVAAWLPVWRAGAVDPTVVLRAE